MPTHRDTDFVSFRGKGGLKFEVFTLPGKAAAFRKNQDGEDPMSILADTRIFTDIKHLRQVSKKAVEEEFGTVDKKKIIEKILLDGKLKVKVYVSKPITELLLDLAFGAELIGALYMLTKRGKLSDFAQMCVYMTIFVMLTTRISRSVGRWFSYQFLSSAPFNDPLKSSTALKHFESQLWQLIVHTSMACLGIWAYSKGRDYLRYPAYFLHPEALLDGLTILPHVEELYIVQLAIWFVTLVSLRFFEVRAGDHHVMYTHHVTTIAVVVVSYGMERYTNFGMVVFLLHDISDIPLDIMKILDLLHLTGASGFYLAEAAYIALMPIWMYCRLYLFPVRLILHGILLPLRYKLSSQGQLNWCYGLMAPGAPLHQKLVAIGKEKEWEEAFTADCKCCAGYICLALLVILECLHIWWTYLLLRIGYRALILGEDTHAVGKEEYFDEGDEDCDNTENKKDK
eukprot:CAMPEP_0184490670 /NCGR_PEP_ID=MMETSP0113_2-20130426/18513_1 /TAXON_ID=91329 /ORGANISM="Norrisiella sphaerica, Strain BC52" /LENGTH=454 /DNA_ID=CAMNT_0026874663 /DNA_START=92 /DNA_END=1456 /DNA_ORIENTATION=-